MSAAPTPPAPAPSLSSSCLWGWLILLLLVVLCLAGSLVAAQRAGRAYVARHLPEWEQRYPRLGFAMALFELRRQLAAETDVPAGRLARRAGEGDGELLPADIAVYPEPLDETYSISADRVTGFQRVAGWPEPVVAYVRREMPARGWTPASERESAGATVFDRTGETGHCRTEIVAHEQPSEIWLRCTWEPASP